MERSGSCGESSSLLHNRESCKIHLSSKLKGKFLMKESRTRPQHYWALRLVLGQKGVLILERLLRRVPLELVEIWKYN